MPIKRTITSVGKAESYATNGCTCY